MTKENDKRQTAEVSLTASPNDGYVALPMREEDFRDFIQSLLGSPQSIGKVIPGVFEIEANDLETLYHLVLQRVGQQNEGSLASFVARIGFSDGSSVELNSLDDLLAYRQVRPVASRSVHLKWDFVVRFADRKAPEKQRIEVSFVSSQGSPPVIDDEAFSFRHGAVFVGYSTGIVSFRIEHTARTWGADLEALLTSHLESLLVTPGQFKETLRKNRGRISFGVFLLFIGSVILGCLLTTNRVVTARIADAVQVLGEAAGNSEAKLDFIAQLVAEGGWAQFYFGLGVLIFVAIFVGLLLAMWVEESLQHSEPSFVLLSSEAHKEKAAIQSQLKRKWRSFGLALITSVVAGVVANVLFSLWFGPQ